jgi:hypothetical protein
VNCRDGLDELSLASTLRLGLFQSHYDCQLDPAHRKAKPSRQYRSSAGAVNLVTQLSHHSWFGAELVEGGRAGSHKTTVPFHATWLDDRSLPMCLIEKADYLRASNTAMRPS